MPRRLRLKTKSKRKSLPYVRAGTQSHVRNDEKLGSSRKWTTEDPRNDAAAKAGVIRQPVALCADTARGSNTKSTHQHPELGQSHRAHMDYDSAQRAIPSFFSERDPKILRSDRGALCILESRAPWFSVACNTSLFDACVAAILSVFQF